MRILNIVALQCEEDVYMFGESFDSEPVDEGEWHTAYALVKGNMDML